MLCCYYRLAIPNNVNDKILLLHEQTLTITPYLYTTIQSIGLSKTSESRSIIAADHIGKDGNHSISVLLEMLAWMPFKTQN